PGEMETPAVKASADCRSRALRARSSSPSMTVTEAGTRVTSSAMRVAVTSMVWDVLGGCCAKATLASSMQMMLVLTILSLCTMWRTGFSLSLDVHARREKEDVLEVGMLGCWDAGM